MKIMTPKDALDAVRELVGLSKAEETVVLAEEPAVEKKVEEAPVQETPSYVSMSDFKSAIQELKDMYAKVLEVVSPSTPEEVPAKLSEETPEVVEETVELAEETVEETVAETIEEDLAEEPVKETVVHDPEVVVNKVVPHLYSQNRAKTTQDYVFDALWNKKNN